MISPNAPQRSSFLAVRPVLGLAAATLLILTAMAHWVRVPPCFADPSPIRFTDAAGQAVHLKSVPRRIVVVGQAPYVILHMLYMFPEAPHRLVGYEQKVKTKELFLTLIDPRYEGKVALQTNPGPEHIAACKPDVVLIKSNTAGPLEKVLASIDIPVVHLYPENPRRFLEAVDQLGVILNNPARAGQIRKYYQSRLDRIAAPLTAVAPGSAPSILVMKYGDRTGAVAMQVPASSWIQTLQVQITGGQPVWLADFSAGDGWQVVGFEQIAQWNPDKLFMVVWYRLDGCQVVRKLMADPKWRRLKAVADQQFFLFPEDIYGWDSPGPRWILGALWMAAHTHPPLFPDLDMHKEVYEFFNHLYGLDRPAVDTHILSRVRLHGCP